MTNNKCGCPFGKRLFYLGHEGGKMLANMMGVTAKRGCLMNYKNCVKIVG